MTERSQSSIFSIQLTLVYNSSWILIERTMILILSMNHSLSSLGVSCALRKGSLFLHSDILVASLQVDFLPDHQHTSYDFDF